MIQSILLVVIVISTIILITYHDDVQISLSEVEICDKRITECYRGVAIILIVLQHCAGELGTNVFTPLGGIGVAMFLFLTGFGLTESFKKKGMGGFLKSKLWRVWMPFFLFYIGIYLLYDNYDCKIFLLNVCSIRQDSYWYVHYMLRCYFIFWIAFNFCYTYRWYLLGTFAIYTFFCMDGIKAEQCLSFPIGVLLSEKKDWLISLSKTKNVQALVLLCIIGITLLVLKQLPEVRNLSDTPYYSLVELGIKLPLGIAAMIILWLLPHRWVINPVLTLCGTLSYELYLVHIQMLGLVHSPFSAWIMLIISLLVAYSFQKSFKQIQNFILK